MERGVQVTETRSALREGCTALIVASNDTDILEQFTTLFPFLQTGFPFVIYSEYMELLTECMLKLRQQDCSIRLQLAESWMREYQVLDCRTHPVMSTSAASGYILSGIKVFEIRSNPNPNPNPNWN